jgi:hypothetical protein
LREREGSVKQDEEISFIFVVIKDISVAVVPQV